MNLRRILRRTRQLWSALFVEPTPQGLNLARKHLSARQMALFMRMDPGEQVHALRVLKTLRRRGEDHPALMVAALLHDSGKLRYPLQVWERVLVVLGGAFFPNQAKVWGRGPARGWRRAFVVAEHHSSWGAELAAECGASPLTVRLIWRHHEPLVTVPETLEDRLLRALQAADEES